MAQRPSVLSADSTVVLGRLAALLADLGARALPDALDLLVEGLGLRSAVLREGGPAGTPGTLIAVAGEVVHAVPHTRDLAGAVPGPPHGGPVVEVPVRHTGRDHAVLVVEGARPSQLPALRAAGAVLGLVLSHRPVPDAPPAGLAALVCDAEDDREALADLLHDGPVQSLVVARYAADAAVRAGDPTGSVAAARDAVQVALVDVRRALWQLRPRASDGLAGGLADLARRQDEAGATPLDVQLDADSAEALAAVEGPVATTAYRLVQAALAGPSPVRVRFDGIALEVTGGSPLTDESRWQRRARAVGAVLETAPGSLRLHLAHVATPAGPAPVAPPETPHSLHRPKATP